MNDLTLDLLARASVAHAEAGADIIAPSGMMDGMVGAIRAGLDAQRLRARGDPELRREVRQRLLRPVSRGRRESASSSATAASTRWTPPTGARRCARWRWTWPRAPTC